MSRESCRMSGNPQARESLGDAYRWYRTSPEHQEMEQGDGRRRWGL